MNGNDFAHFLNLPLLRMPAADIGGEKTRCDGIDHDPVAASTGATECMRWAAPALAAVGSADRRFALMRRNRSRDYHAARPLQAQEPSACVQRCEDAVHVDVDHNAHPCNTPKRPLPCAAAASKQARPYF